MLINAETFIFQWVNLITGILRDVWFYSSYNIFAIIPQAFVAVSEEDHLLSLSCWSVPIKSGIVLEEPPLTSQEKMLS